MSKVKSSKVAGAITRIKLDEVKTGTVLPVPLSPMSLQALDMAATMIINFEAMEVEQQAYEETKTLSSGTMSHQLQDFHFMALSIICFVAFNGGSSFSIVPISFRRSIFDSLFCIWASKPQTSCVRPIHVTWPTPRCLTLGPNWYRLSVRKNLMSHSQPL